MDTFCGPQCLYIKGFTVLLLLSSYFGMVVLQGFFICEQENEWWGGLRVIMMRATCQPVDLVNNFILTSKSYSAD